MQDISPLRLSLVVTTAAMLFVVPLGLGIAWWLTHGRRFRGKGLFELLFTLPLVLPPTVVGYALLLALGRGTAFGRWLNDSVSIRLLFTWQGAAIAAAVMAFPLFVRPAAAAFAAIDPELLDAGRTLGASEMALFLGVVIPVAYRGLLAGCALAYARALGEFGATWMIAGNIPGQTQTLPLALYDAALEGRDVDAMRLAAILTTTAFALLGALIAFERRLAVRRSER
jgi:molybdate transport system permease protein